MYYDHDAAGKKFLVTVLDHNSLCVHGDVRMELEEYGGERTSHRTTEAHPRTSVGAGPRGPG